MKIIIVMKISLKLKNSENSPKKGNMSLHTQVYTLYYGEKNIIIIC